MNISKCTQHIADISGILANVHKILLLCGNIANAHNILLVYENTVETHGSVAKYTFSLQKCKANTGRVCGIMFVEIFEST